MRKTYQACVFFLVILTVFSYADRVVVFNEIMYHPAVDEAHLEWIEFHNQMAVDVDMSAWQVRGGIDYDFPEGSMIPGGGYLVLAISPADLQAQSGYVGAYGPWEDGDRLANNGEELRLQNNSGRLMDIIDYRHDGDWPSAPDGSGVSLAKINPDSASEPAENWGWSRQMGGTPGGMNNQSPSLPFVRFNEVAPASGDPFWVELINGSSESINLSGYVLRCAGWTNGDYVFPSRSLDAGQCLVIYESTLGFHPADEDKLFLYTPGQAMVADAVVVKNSMRGRFPEATGKWLYPDSGTPGSANSFAFHDEIVINEIMYHSYVPNPDTESIDETILVDIDGVWKFDDTGTDLGTAWRERVYPAAASWRSGNALFGYSGSSPPEPILTPLTTNRITYYFRNTFNYNGELTENVSLNIDAIIDDGVVFYLNGTEVYRFNMPEGPISYTTYASGMVAVANYISTITIPVTNLVVGENVLAVEVHEAGPGTSVPGPNINASPGFTISYDGNKGDYYCTSVPNNAARTTYGTVAFGSSQYGAGIHLIANANDGQYGNSHSWLSNFVAGDPNPYIGLKFNRTVNITSIAWGRDNACSALSDRSLGVYTIQFTTVTSPGVSTPETGNAATGWKTIGTVGYIGGQFNPPVRHRYEIAMNASAISATGLRIKVSDNSICIDEIEIYEQSPVVVRDIVFGAKLRALTHQPIDEAGQEWIELYNRSDHTVDLTGWQFTDAIRYDFPPGTMIESHGYLVVANDADKLRLQYPAIDILGDFSLRLANDGDNILLVDSNNNPADEVRYYNGSPWPAYADGCGASLELRDPDADNSKPEAWASSDEGSRNTWKTYTYSGISSQIFGPSTWNELVLGMLDSGEVLLDDISVIENPEGSRVQVIQNGGFESDVLGGPAAKWRIIGNHHGQVVLDPHNPSNKVLHLTATGATTYPHNHAETTFVGNRKIADGTKYEISYKAKWLGGSNQLNSRLYCTRLGKTILLDVPQLNGTPGTQNSCYRANIGPTFGNLCHNPVVPESFEQVTVSVTSKDPDGINFCKLWWRVDGSSWNSQLMTHQGNGLYSALIPAKPAATLVQFYVEAQDGLGAMSTYPAAGPDSRALYKVKDGLAFAGGLQNFRVLMLNEDNNLLFTTTNLMSNQQLGSTVIYNEREAYYDTGTSLRGSAAGRARDGDNFQNYDVGFQADHLFRGVHSSVAIDRSGRTPVTRGQDEIYIKHMFNRAGIPCMYDDLIYLIVPKSTHIGSSLLMMAGYEKSFLESSWENGGDGTVFNLDYTYEPVETVDGNPESLKKPSPFVHVVTDFSDLGDDKETYRCPMMIKNNRRRDDYSGLINFCKTMTLPSAQLQAKVEDVLDIDEWVRCMALGTLCGIGDSYFSGSVHNIRVFVRPDDQKVVALPWDMDFVFFQATNSSLFSQANSIRQILLMPVYQRLFYGHLQDLVNTTFNTTYMTYWMNHYSSLLPGQDFTPQLSYIQARGAYALSQLPAQIAFAITTNGGSNFSVDAEGVTLEGNGWINVRNIRWVEQDKKLDVTWTSGSAWQVSLPLEPGLNPITLEAYDFQGKLIAADTITVTSTIAERPLRQYLRVTELMYNPIGGSDYEFIEFRNIGPEALDLTNLYFSNGIDFAFAGRGITSLSPGEYLVVAANPAVFATRYDTSGMNLVGPFSGKFANEGERVSLSGQYGALILEFTYSDGRGWPLSADGPGHSLVPLNDAVTGQAEVSLDYGFNWRASTFINGSPGVADPEIPVSVILNEIMTHTDLNDPAYPDHDSNDWIELYNPTETPKTLSGGHWYLSDNKDIPAKWQIPETTIPAHGWVSFDEITGFHQDPLSDEGFGLDKAGGVVLLSYISGTNMDRVVDAVRYEGQENDISYGRFPDGDKFWQATTPSRDQANNKPLTHMMITEIMYHPLSAGKEYIEIFNPTSQPVSLWDTDTETGWRIGGAVEFIFPQSAMIEPHGHAIVVGFEPDAGNIAEFEAMYGSVPCHVFGPYTGFLSNGGERLALEKPQAPDDIGDTVSWVIIDEVIYSDDDPWPIKADGYGNSLSRNRTMLCGNDPASWSFVFANPGTWDADFNRDGEVNLADLAIFCESWLSESGAQNWNPRCDLSRPPDQRIDLYDLIFFSKEW
jgi:hypothetical protein